jgi:hypothetical protein
MWRQLYLANSALGSTLKELYRFGPSAVEVIPYSCVALCSWCRVQRVYAQPSARGFPSGLYRVCEVGVHNELVLMVFMASGVADCFMAFTTGNCRI